MRSISIAIKWILKECFFLYLHETSLYKDGRRWREGDFADAIGLQEKRKETESINRMTR